MVKENPYPSLAVDIAGIRFKNPIMTASGTFGYGLEFESFYDISKLGAISVKGLSLEPRKGTPPPRIYETPSGMLNAIGLQNVGVEAFIRDKLPLLRDREVTVIANIFGATEEEYVRLAARLNEVQGVAALELNISCPNVAHGGIEFGSTPEGAHRITRAVVAESDLPVIPKLSPNVSDIGAVAKGAEEAGAAALSLINTLVGMAVDVKKKCPVLSRVTGGLSGPAIRPVALAMVYKAKRAVAVPLIGMGGIATVEDVIAFLMCGASAVQVGTANFVDPGVAGQLVDGLADYCRENDIEDLQKLIGSLEVPEGPMDLV